MFWRSGRSVSWSGQISLDGLPTRPGFSMQGSAISSAGILRTGLESNGAFDVHPVAVFEHHQVREHPRLAELRLQSLAQALNHGRTRGRSPNMRTAAT